MADGTDRDEGFVARWSRRKRESGRSETDESVAHEAVDAPEGEAGTSDAEAEANRLAAEAVDIDALGKGDDFAMFLKRGVPAALRRKALRRLWRINPTLANLDGLNDYEEDFRNPAHQAYSSLWRAGRGFLSAEEQESQQASGRLAPVSEAAPDDAVSLAEDDGEHVQGKPEARECGKAAPVPVDAESVETAGSDEPEEDVGSRPPRVSIRRRLEG